MMTRGSGLALHSSELCGGHTMPRAPAGRERQAGAGSWGGAAYQPRPMRPMRLPRRRPAHQSISHSLSGSGLLGEREGSRARVGAHAGERTALRSSQRPGGRHPCKHSTAPLGARPPPHAGLAPFRPLSSPAHALDDHIQAGVAAVERLELGALVLRLDPAARSNNVPTQAGRQAVRQVRACGPECTAVAEGVGGGGEPSGAGQRGLLQLAGYCAAARPARACRLWLTTTCGRASCPRCRSGVGRGERGRGEAE